jgi:glycosyltransferase involved in cell wall biosynthesis
MPAVSVIIPTYLRPDLVVRAVRSALGQTFADLEVVVVVDGRDAATVAALEALGDARLRALVPDRNLGNAGARNHGIAAARGAWIALLDDDDWWAPEKIERQMALAAGLEAPLPVVSCRFEAVGEGARFVWPRSFPREGQPVSEYLFTRRRPSVEGAVQTSTFLAPRALFDRAAFDPSLDRYVDLDWLLRASEEPGFALAFVPGGPLSTYSIDAGRARISNQRDWQRDVAWIRARRHLVTPRAYAGYLLTQASIRAELGRDRGAFLPLLLEALRQGRASPGELLFHTANTFMPRDLRRRLTSTPRAEDAGAPSAGPAR